MDRSLVHPRYKDALYPTRLLHGKETSKVGSILRVVDMAMSINHFIWLLAGHYAQMVCKGTKKKRHRKDRSSEYNKKTETA